MRGIIFGVSTELTDADIVSETGALAARKLTRRMEVDPHADDISSAAANRVFRFGGGGALISLSAAAARECVIFAGCGAARRQFDHKAKCKKYSVLITYTNAQYHIHNVHLLQANLYVLQPTHK